MRAPRRLIPTKSFGLSIGVGALVPFAISFLPSDLPHETFLLLVILLLFVGGFLASVVFGTSSPGGFGYTILICVIACLVIGSVPIAGIFLKVQLSRAIGLAIYFYLLSVLVFPPLFFIPLIVLILGAKVGWIAAESLER